MMLTLNVNCSADVIQDSDMAESILGSYEGAVSNGDDYDPVATTFYRDAQGELAGSYVIEEEQGSATGNLSEFRTESKYTAVFTWSDKYGDGTLRILFSEDYQLFAGFWGSNGAAATLPWLGAKQGPNTIGAEETTNHKIQMPHYSVALSPDHSWHIEKLGDPFESVLLTKQMATTPLGPIVVEIKFMRNIITDESFRAKTARWNADNFRTIEKNIMIEQGVNTGMYELGDVTMGDEEIAGKTFYFTDYKTYTSSDRQWSSLYLFFPKEKDNDAFIVAHHSVRMPLEAVLFEYSKTDLIDLLRTLNVE